MDVDAQHVGNFWPVCCLFPAAAAALVLQLHLQGPPQLLHHFRCLAASPASFNY